MYIANNEFLRKLLQLMFLTQQPSFLIYNTGNFLYYYKNKFQSAMPTCNIYKIAENAIEFNIQPPQIQKSPHSSFLNSSLSFFATSSLIVVDDKKYEIFGRVMFLLLAMPTFFVIYKQELITKSCYWTYNVIYKKHLYFDVFLLNISYLMCST